jgi:group I intron endonuclease
LKERYSGVYEILNNANGNRYIGSSRNIYNRICSHKSLLKKGTHQNKHLQNAWNKYTEELFSFSVLCCCDPVNQYLYEQLFIDQLKPEYNKSLVALHPAGWKHTQEWKDDQSIRLSGRVFSEEHKLKISDSKKGDNHHMCKLKETEIEEMHKVWIYGGARLTMAKLAKAWGLSQGYVSRLIRMERRPHAIPFNQ